MTTVGLIAPHGGALVNRFLDDHARARALEDASRLPSIQLTAVQHSDLLCIATGVFSPLTGFVRRADYESIVERMRLADGTIWTLPVTLAVSSDRARQIGPGANVALLDPAGSIVATMNVTETFAYDKRLEADRVYRTEDSAHPGVARLYEQGDVSSDSRRGIRFIARTNTSRRRRSRSATACC